MGKKFFEKNKKHVKQGLEMLQKLNKVNFYYLSIKDFVCLCFLFCLFLFRKFVTILKNKSSGFYFPEILEH